MCTSRICKNFCKNMKTIVLLLLLLFCESNAFITSISNSKKTRYSISYNNEPLLLNQKGNSRICLKAEYAEEKEQQLSKDPPRLIYAALWVGLISYAFTLSPGGSPEAGAIDSSIIARMISTPFDGSLNPIFVGVFNFLGVIPAVLGALLLPGSKDQKIPALPFVIASFAVGLFGIGPYLGLRNINTEVTQETRGWGSAAFEFKGTAVLLGSFAVYLYYYSITESLAMDGGVAGAIRGYLDLFTHQRLVHVSSMDFMILSLAMWDPLREDMARRYSSSNPSPLPAWVYCSLPALGPAMYLLLRPSLPSEETD